MEALTRDKTLCIASHRDSIVRIIIIHYLSRNSFFPPNSKNMETLNKGVKLILANNRKLFVVTIWTHDPGIFI